MSDEETTQPSIVVAVAAVALMPEQPKTMELPAADPVRVLLMQIQQSMTLGFRETNANIDLVTGDVKSLKDDVRGLQKWKLDSERMPSLTSERVRAVVDERASHVDLEAQAREADQIIKNAERDRQIAETRSLVEQAATKADVKVLAACTATKIEVAAIVSPITEQLGTQDTTLADQNTKLDAILVIAKATASALGSKRLRYFLLVCAALGAMVGGAVAGWNAHEVSKALPSLPALPLPAHS